MGHASRRISDLTRTFNQVVGREPLLQRDQALRVTAYYEDGSAKLVRGHRDEVSLQQHQALLFGEPFAQHRSLLLEPNSTIHQLNCIAPKHDDRARHLADLIVTLRTAYVDARVIRSEPMHALSEG